MSQVILFLRSLVFTTILFVSTLTASGTIALLFAFPYAWGYRIVIVWADFVLWLCRTLCRLDYTVEGRENIPEQNTVVLLKHQSAWETIAQVQLFPRQTWVAKVELMWLPFIGWALRVLKPIAINRKTGRSAVKQVLQQGKNRLDHGFWVMIFPEGTRMAAGATRRYGVSGALLACKTGRPVVPVAHNAGDFWPRRGLLKRPGTIRVVIGPPIETEGRTPQAVNQEAQAWIEGTMARISDRYSQQG